MAQVLPHFCPRCGAPIAVEQQPRFCSQCQLDLQTYLVGSNSPQVSNPGFPPAGPISNPGFAPALQSPSSPFPASQPSWGQPQSPIEQPQKPPKSGMRKGALVLILLAVLVVLGTAGYLGWQFLGPRAGQPAITTTPINATVTYAGVTLTVQQVQQSQRFIDDPNTDTAGMVRLSLQGKNTGTAPVNLLYTNIAWLVLPGGRVIAPTYVKSDASLAPGATQTSIVDFAVPSNIKVEQLVLRVGAAAEAQMDIPLTGHADLAAYAPKTSTINKQLEYQGLNWTLVNATSQLNLDTQQASKGMRYVTVAFAIDNTLAQTAIPGSPYDYMRLQAGNSSLSPVASTLPTSFEAGAMGKTGAVTFLVPQNAAILGLVLLPQNGFNQRTVNIQF